MTVATANALPLMPVDRDGETFYKVNTNETPDLWKEGIDVSEIDNFSDFFKDGRCYLAACTIGEDLDVHYFEIPAKVYEGLNTFSDPLRDGNLHLIPDIVTEPLGEIIEDDDNVILHTSLVPSGALEGDGEIDTNEALNAILEFFYARDLPILVYTIC